jgi:endonuclease/exonuclease/phosphatase family metal-dependent hydrolase
MIIKKTKKLSSKNNIKKINKTNRLKTNKSENKNGISILSYNVSWESMTGKKKNWSLCSVQDNKTHPKHFSVCVGNISQVIEENNSDFVCLQEAADYEKLIKESPRLAKMKYEYHKSGLDDMITFWKPKYGLLYSIKGQFEEGRPWLATIFDNGLCLINVHFGHYNDSGEFEMMELMFRTVQKGIKIEEKKKGKKNNKQNVNRYIISGDFNNDIKKFGDKDFKFILNKTHFHYHPKYLLTCRIGRRCHYDHVIDSKSMPIDIIIPNVHHMASDHKPILAKLDN